MEHVGLFYGLLVYFTAIWYILCSFRIFCGVLVYYSSFWYIVQRKIWSCAETSVVTTTTKFCPQLKKEKN
jgi:hypothetical protein